MSKNIVVVGGGIIGCSTAYYITRHSSYSPESTSLTILEASSIASAASGKAGGLVAKWAFPRELVNVSFGEHVRLAQEHDGEKRWGFRFVNVGQWVGKGRNDDEGVDIDSVTGPGKKSGEEGTIGAPSTLLPQDLDWVEPDLTDAYEPMAEEGETLQVHPYQFTTSMCELAQEAGAKLVAGRATEVVRSDDGKSVVGVAYIDDASNEQKVLKADTVVVAAGPWTPTLVPKAPIYGSRAHSITIRPTRRVSAYTLFTEISIRDSEGPRSSRRVRKKTIMPEIYARPNDEVYACGAGGHIDDNSVEPPLPSLARDVEVNKSVCEKLFKQVGSISRELRGGTVTAEQACYLPQTKKGPSGCPMVGAVEGVRGLIVAAGHTCWGICNAPGTGKAVSELVMDGRISCGELSRLEPRMFM